MGFGFNLFVIFILFPLIIILTIIWVITRKIIIGRIIKNIFFSFIGFLCLIFIIRIFTDKKQLNKEDFYGEYIIDRSKFSGKQADWQYDHFRFEITKQNKIFFNVTEKDRILKTYSGSIQFVSTYFDKQIPAFKIDTPTYHIFNQPTLYRQPFSFYYVFNSYKFGNVFFIKGKWKKRE
jgi:hypothetical protein